jgi:hypothetical protein
MTRLIQIKKGKVRRVALVEEPKRKSSAEPRSCTQFEASTY